MNKSAFFFLVTLFITLSMGAWGWSASNHINLGFASSVMKANNSNMVNLKSNSALVCSFGRTLYSNNTIANDIQYGFTFDVANITYSQYELMEIYYWKTETAEFKETNYSIALGGELNLPVFKYLDLAVSTKYLPGYSMLQLNESSGKHNKYKGMSNAISLSCDISFSKIGLGLEYRLSSVKYKDNCTDSSISDMYPEFWSRYGYDKGNVQSNSILIYLKFNF